VLAHTYGHRERAIKQNGVNANMAQQMAQRLPSHRQLINQVKQQGFAKL